MSISLNESTRTLKLLAQQYRDLTAELCAALERHVAAHGPVEHEWMSEVMLDHNTLGLALEHAHPDQAALRALLEQWDWEVVEHTVPLEGDDAATVATLAESEDLRAYAAQHNAHPAQGGYCE